MNDTMYGILWAVGTVAVSAAIAIPLGYALFNIIDIIFFN